MPNVRTIQDVFDEMSDEKKDLVALIVGAAEEGIELPEELGAAAGYDSLTEEQQHFLHFVVGNMPSSVNVEHSAIDEGEELMHFGVKGMRWGFRNSNPTSSTPSSSSVDKSKRPYSNGPIPLSKNHINTKENRATARAKVKAGTATLKDAHVAALKSKGHRAVNALLGDKRYWVNTLKIAGAAALGVGAAFAIPALLPASALIAVGGTAGLSYLGPAATATLGSQMITGAIIETTGVAANIAGLANTVTNTARAVRGNSRVSKSYASLGKHMYDNQRAGSEKVKSVLVRQGGLRKKLVHSDILLSEMREVENVLEHYGVKGMRWGVHKDYLGTTDIRSGSSGVVTRPLTKRAMNNNPRGPDAFKTAAATHNIGVMLRRRAMAPDSAISKYNAEWRASGKAKKNEHRDEYDREYARLMTKEANKFTKPGTNARVHVIRAKDGHVTIHLTTASSKAVNKGYNEGMQSRDDVEIVHASNESPEVVIMEAILDPDGLIVDFKVSDGVKHDDLTGDDVLMHYGIKGMRWGFRRSDSQLAKARVTNEDGDEEEINVRSSDKGVRQRLKNMRTGEVLVVADKPDSPPKLLIKQADGSFKETRLSADAEKFIKTMNKDPHEMSDREIKEANNRAQAVEQYNKLFNPIPDPNKELQARVDALKLQQTYSQMQAQMNPSRTKRAIGFIQSIEPAFKEFQKVDKMTGGILSKNMKDAARAVMTDTRTPKVKKTKVKVAPQVANLKIRNPKKGKKNPNVVFNISDVGTPYDASNPFIPALGTRGGS